jgi:hypothetical protein
MITVITKTQFRYDSVSKEQIIKTEYLGMDLRFHPTAEIVLGFKSVLDALAAVMSLRLQDSTSVYSVDSIEESEL